MKTDVAEFVARVALKATSEFTGLIPVIKELAESEEEYEQFRKALTAIAKIASEEIFLPIFSEHPEIDDVIGKTINDFGRLP